MVQVLGYGRLPAQISFLAGNLREAVLGRNEEHLRQSREAAEAMRSEGADSLSTDSHTRERWELLHAVSESLDRAHSPDQPLDKVALSTFASELSLLESLAR
ncbi:MAG: hypothetical protein ABI972_10620 [Acidobacteriota bacterium]